MAGKKTTPPSKAMPPLPKAIPAPSAAPSKANEDWNSMSKAKTPQSKPVSNEEIISLEDKEFGRY